MLTPSRNMDVVVADSNLSLLQDLGRFEFSPGDYFGTKPVWRAMSGSVNEQDRKVFDLVMSRRYTSISDLRVLHRFSMISGASTRRMDVYFARDCSPEGLKLSNIVFVGSRRSNPWVALFDQQLGFSFEWGQELNSSAIVDRRAADGERKRYSTEKRGEVIDAYGTITFLPNLAGTGQVLILSGSGPHATESAGEVVTDPQLFSQLLRRLKWDGQSALPYFEAMIQTSVIGATMRRPEILFARKLQIPGH
ncbi:MAG: hypothetical protein HY821_14655 [Acidobacteria bacterium]|nr:hypothetical protein [Acidobacteriota bacterium]